MPAFEVYDTVVLKGDKRLVGTVERTSSDSYDPLDDTLIIAHVDVPPPVLTEFVTSGVPPRGYVFVQFADEECGSALVHESDLTLLNRSFQIGDHVKRDQQAMTGVVVDVSESLTLEPICHYTPGEEITSASFSGLQAKNQYTPDDCRRSECSSEPSSSSSSSRAAPSPIIITEVPSRELIRARDVVEGDFIISHDWLGGVEEVELDVTIALENKSVVVVHDPYDLHLAVPDFGKPLVSLPEFDELRRPDVVVALAGWSTTIPLEEPKLGQCVVTQRSNLRRGRWLCGSYDPKGSTQGVIVDVRARQIRVQWLTCNAFAPLTPSEVIPPSSKLSLYENIKSFRSSSDLRAKKEVTVYDSGKSPLSMVEGRMSTGECEWSSGKAPGKRDISSGQDFRVGDHVKFRDPTAAAVKYHGGRDSSSPHGKFVRIPLEAAGGWDLNEFKVLSARQEAAVLWQDGSLSCHPSLSLNKFALFEAELAPSDIVLKRDGMKQKAVGSRGNSGAGRLDDFNEMTFFERPHDLIPGKVGIIQSIDPNERVARVRWYTAPKIEIQMSGQLLASKSYFGEIGDDVEDVSLYEIMTFHALLRNHRDMVVIPPAGGPSRRAIENLQHPTNDHGIPRSDLGFALLHAQDKIRERGLDKVLAGAAQSESTFKPDNDWFGEIVHLGLDGGVTVRLGGSQCCRDVHVGQDDIITILSEDSPGYSQGSEDYMMDLDDWASSEEGSDFDRLGRSSPTTISESIEYEGGERIDHDSGDENWVSDEEALSADGPDGDKIMQDSEPQQPQKLDGEEDAGADRRPPVTGPPSLAYLRSQLGTEAPPAFAVLEEDPPPDQFGLHSATNASALLKRIRFEHRILSTALPAGEIYVRTYESRLDLLRCLIIGPADTPYEYAPFLIDLYLPAKFPREPPTAHFHSWTSGLGRINPNLYEEGKICLSLLGTWPGKSEQEGWSEKATILQVLVSLQGLVLVTRPFYNEAGFEGYEEEKAYVLESQLYSEKAFVMARNFVKHAVLRPPRGLEDVLAWLYLSREGAPSSTNLLATVISRGKRLLQKSQDARRTHDESLLDGAGEKGDVTKAFLKPLSQGAAVMLERTTNDLEAELAALRSQAAEHDDSGSA